MSLRVNVIAADSDKEAARLFFQETIPRDTNWKRTA
jgi:hypothetical protein